MGNTMEVRKRERHTTYRKRRGHDKTVMSVPETMAGGMASACKEGEQ